MIISRTPFRLSFFGGGTDYPVWYREHGGSVISTTIDKYCYISCRYLPPFFEHNSRIVYSKIELVKTLDEIEHPSVRETLKYMGIDGGVEIHHDGDIPARTGIGSSSAFTVGLLHALYGLKRRMPTKVELATDAIKIERDILKEAVGCQDQIAASVGGLNKIVFHNNDSFEVQPVILEKDRLISFQEHNMLYFTGFSRYASNIARKQIESTAKKKKSLHRMLAMVDEAQDILRGSGDVGDIGELLHESWMLKRELTDKISTPEIDAMYDAARSAGALGGKLIGAGGGGFMLIYARPEDQPAIREKLSHLLHVPFRFETTGTQIVFYRPNARRSDKPIMRNKELMGYETGE